MGEKMMFSDAESLKQMTGWVIEEVIPGGDASLALRVSHVAAPNQQLITIKPGIQVAMMGNVTVHNPAMMVSAEPVIKKEG